MPPWPIILFGALAGGLLLLHGFGKTKAVSELMLDTYQNLLNHAAPPEEDKRSCHGGTDDAAPAEQTTASDNTANANSQ